MCGIWALFGFNGDLAVHCNAAYKIRHRGPDAFRLETVYNCCLGFHRLSIIDALHGMQPLRVFAHPNMWLIYNGEIYNYKLLQKQFGFQYSTECDGEVIIHLYAHGGIEFAAKHLDGVFGFCLLDTANRKVYVGRDTFGVKPVFFARNKYGKLAVCSEAKGLMPIIKSKMKHTTVRQFLPGHVESYCLDVTGNVTFEKRVRFSKFTDEPVFRTITRIHDDIKNNIRNLLEDAVTKRLMAERRIGCLLSGGLDSSIVAALLMKKAKEMGLKYPIQTFCIGMEGSPDLKEADKVAKHIGSEHHMKVFTKEEGIHTLDSVIYHLESYDVDVIRSAVGSYLISKYIKEKTDTTVILSGDGADELMQGYKMFKNGACHAEREDVSIRLCENLYLFDLLRADRTTAAWGLEIRVPFLDRKFSRYFSSLPADLKGPQNGKEKYLIRSAFDGSGLLPNDILWRPKVVFSNGVCSGTQTWDTIMEQHAARTISDEELNQESLLYKHNPPKTKEALYYRRIFDKYYPDQEKMIPFQWDTMWSKCVFKSDSTSSHHKND